MEVAANCSLRVKRPLLDPRFEGYKLSLEPLPCYQLELDAGGKRRRPPALSPLSAAGSRTLSSFSSFLSWASKATGAFRISRRASVDRGWPPLEREAHPGTQWESPSPGSARVPGSVTQLLPGLWALSRPWPGPRFRSLASSVTVCVEKPHLGGPPRWRRFVS